MKTFRLGKKKYLLVVLLALILTSTVAVGAMAKRIRNETDVQTHG